MPKGFRKEQRQEMETAAAYTAAGLQTDKEQAKQEAKAIAETRKRGQPVFRVSVGFTPEVYEYINTMAHFENTSLTGYLIKLLAKDRERNEEIYQAFKALQERKAAQEEGGGK